MTRGLKPPPERKQPIEAMSSAELSRYRRALVHYLKRCPQDEPRHEEQRACLAEVMAEEQARRLINCAGGITLTVPRIRLLDGA